ncbi:MAG: HEPN domain-containing protein [Candidatus Woesearchaeota archaeon]|nr:HEPN domain-containing protein [Candidatus Woesearchaeota archaeon]
MHSVVEIFLERADNELLAAESLKKLSEEAKLKEEFKLPSRITFYSSVISHSYYAIFYSAKGILLTKGIKTSAPEVHRKTFEAFKENLVDTGILDVRILEIYKRMAIRADELLEIFKDEKWKRGNFTYNTIPQANKEPAENSLRNAKTFVSSISKVIHGI